jgi:capsular polysaccharide biosynthesis protein
MDEVSDISVERLVVLLLKHKFLIMGSGVLGLVLALILSTFMLNKKYESSVKLYVYTPSLEQQTPVQDMNALNYAQKIVNTYIEMLSTRVFYRKILEETALTYSETDLTNMIKFEALNQTEVFMVTVTSPNPEDSEGIARAISSLAPKVIADIQENAYLKIVDPAILNPIPSSPKVRTNLAIGFGVGVGLTVVFVFLKDMFGDKIKSGEDLLNKYNVNILAEIADIGRLERIDK